LNIVPGFYQQVDHSAIHRSGQATTDSSVTVIAQIWLRQFKRKRAVLGI
jgi:hypothetical protein